MSMAVTLTERDSAKVEAFAGLLLTGLNDGAEGGRARIPRRASDI